jgi:hypothetical protein
VFWWFLWGVWDIVRGRICFGLLSVPRSQRVFSIHSLRMSASLQRCGEHGDMLRTMESRYTLEEEDNFVRSCTL